MLKRVCLAAFVLAVTCSVHLAFAASDGSSELPKTNAAYMWVKVAPAIYYRVYGVYPQNWAAVRASGIVQVPLLTSLDKPVDPDDKQLDFMGDVIYVYRGPQTVPLLHTLTSRDGTVVKKEEVDQSFKTYLEMFDLHESTGRMIPAAWRTEECRRLMGIAAALNHASLVHHNVAGHSLRSVEELLNFRLSPVNAQSNDPVLGRALSFGGGSLSLLFRWQASAAGERDKLAIVQVIDSDGQVIDGLTY